MRQAPQPCPAPPPHSVYPQGSSFQGGRCGSACGSTASAQFEIDEFHRFEGMSDPEDQSIVHAISSVDGHIKGILVSAYGAYASGLTQELVRKLATH